MTETVADRVLATPRTDVIPGKSLAPKTEGAERLIMRELVEDHIQSVARSCLAARLPTETIAQAVSTAGMNAALYGRAMAIQTVYGVALSVWASLKDAEQEDPKEIITVNVALKLIGLAKPEKIVDFLRWYWRIGEYEIPKEGPAKPPASQSATAKSSAESSNATQDGLTKTSAD